MNYTGLDQTRQDQTSLAGEETGNTLERLGGLGDDTLDC